MLSARWDELPSYQIGFEQGIEEGKLEGEIKGKIEVAIKLLPIFDNQQISEYTDLSVLQIEELRPKD